MEKKQLSPNAKIGSWLILCAILVLSMVLIGGYTRLSGSGLSIVEWKPVVGAIYPMSEESWLEEFAKYRASPEFKFKNSDFTLEQFKQIYFVEYFHRLIGRITGLVFFIPLIYFSIRKYFSFSDIKHFLLISFLGLIQGWVGWYMVKSGLDKDPYVSHIRLAFHLMTAATIYCLILWKAFSYFVNTKHYINQNQGNYIFYCFTFAVVILQMFYGAFVAGLDAGLLFNDFPCMNGKLIANDAFIGVNLILDIINNPATVQFIHRFVGTILLIMAIANFFTYQNLYNFIFLILFLMQYFIGVLTLIKFVPMNLALIHQIFAFLILGFSLFYVYLSGKIQK